MQKTTMRITIESQQGQHYWAVTYPYLLDPIETGEPCRTREEAVNSARAIVDANPGVFADVTL